METQVLLEHINITVNNADVTAKILCDLFGWHVRWSGESIHNGYTVHVGDKQQYLALYTPVSQAEDGTESYFMLNGLNHIGIVVDDLDAVEGRVINAGYKPFSHADYEPGKRFYFRDENNIEFEIVMYG